MIMSGVEDGKTLDYDADGHGTWAAEAWTLTIGRHDERDIPLKKDTFISRDHARLCLRDGAWWLKDCDSRNGTFIEQDDDETRVTSEIPLQPGQLFRIGRTWLRLT
jgi:pSer/pThr/pTyr-binding forkhead associated (FHA) protein